MHAPIAYDHAMNASAKRHPCDIWTRQTDQGVPPEPGYAAHIRGAIEEGRAQIAAGRGVPADEAWKKLGIE